MKMTIQIVKYIAQHHHDINDRLDGHDKRIVLLETMPKAA